MAYSVETDGDRRMITVFDHLDAAAVKLRRADRKTLSDRCTKIADQVVPRYRQLPYPSCGGTIATQWQAAWDGACIALGGDPAEYRG